MKAGSPGANQLSAAKRYIRLMIRPYRTYATPAHVATLEAMSRPELLDHCSRVLERHIAESQARQIAILAAHGIHQVAA